MLPQTPCILVASPRSARELRQHCRIWRVSVGECCQGWPVNSPITVVGRTPDGHDLLAKHEFVALHDCSRQWCAGFSGPHLPSWCARAINSMSFVWQKLSTTSPPNRKPAPRGDIPQPWMSARRQQSFHGETEEDFSSDLPSGSDHSRSQKTPSCGTSCFLSIALICRVR